VEDQDRSLQYELTLFKLRFKPVEGSSPQQISNASGSCFVAILRARLFKISLGSFLFFHIIGYLHLQIPKLPVWTSVDFLSYGENLGA
jgi:hypothetical protein